LRPFACQFTFQTFSGNEFIQTEDPNRIAVQKLALERTDREGRGFIAGSDNEWQDSRGVPGIFRVFRIHLAEETLFPIHADAQQSAGQ